MESLPPVPRYVRRMGLTFENFIPIYQAHSYCRKLLLPPRSVKPSQTMRAADREPAGGEIPVELVAASRLMTSHSGPGCRGQIGLL